MDKRILIGGVLLLALAGGGGWYAWRHQAPPPRVAEPAPAEPPAEAPAAPASAAPAVRYPVATLPELPPPDAPAAGDAPPAATDFAGLLRALLGGRAAALLQGDDLIDRIVVTVDNLGREHATPRLWPVQPTGGRFTTQRDGAAERIAPTNAARYQPFVRLAEGIDTPAAVALYVRFYPRFQQAYSALGYPRVYFNDRLVDVIDLLLATPVPEAAAAVRLPERTPGDASPPWTRYEFVDPAFQGLSAGQKMLLRMGSDNALRLKAKLAEMRRALVTPATPR